MTAWRKLALGNLLGPRGKRVVSAGIWSLLAKLAGAANLFIAVPFVLRALGKEEFGAWATLVSLVTFAGFLDFGLGNGTMNLIAAAHGRGAFEEVAAVLQEARRTLLQISALLAVAAVIALPLLPWHRLLGLTETYAGSSRVGAAAVLFAIVLSVPLNLAARVQLGLGRGEIAFRWQMVGQLLTLMMVIALARTGASFGALTAAAVGTPLLGAAANTLTLGQSTRQFLTARRPDLAKKIRNEGLLFFILQLAAALAFAADLPLISMIRGPADAGIYAIVQRLFSIIPLALGLIWAPLWPIYRQALAAGSHDWAMRTLQRSLLFAVLFSAALATVLAVGFDTIAPIWLRHPLQVGGLLLVGMLVWTVVDAAGSALATFFNAASLMKYQVTTACIFAVTCLIAKIWVIGRFGMSGIPWAAAATFALINLIPMRILQKQLLQAALAKTY